MYISTYNTYINPTQPYNKPSTLPSAEPYSNFKEHLLYKTIDTYNTPKSFPVDYINKGSTFYNKLRMQQEIASDKEIAKSLDASSHVNSFDILKKRESAYTQTKYKITSSLKNSYSFAPRLSGIDFNVQKSAIANIYADNASYFTKRAV